MSDFLPAVSEARERFLGLVPTLRPELHRYCARMTGSVSDGEDVVRDTLAKAPYALAELESVPPLRPWSFKIAHTGHWQLEPRALGLRHALQLAR
ncbi:MAG: sigma factor [Myxococcales bacterium]